MVESLEPLMRTGDDFGAIEVTRQRLVQDVGHERRFSRARHTRYRDEQSERNVYGEILEIVVLRAQHTEHASGAGDTAPGPQRNAQLAAEMPSGQRVVTSKHRVQRPR